MGQLNNKKSIEVNASINKVWEIIGPNFADISKWARGINNSWINEDIPKEFDDAPAGGRFCDVKGFGKMQEDILNYDSTNYNITWTADGEKIPGFVKRLQNSITLEKVSETKTKITSHLTADLLGVKGKLLGGVISKQFSKAIDGFFTDWKIYAETGDISATKKRELQTA